MRFRTTYSNYFKQNLHMFDALVFLAGLTQHIPPEQLQLIRRCVLYASRTKGRWEEMPSVAERAPEGWRDSHPTALTSEEPGYKPLPDSEEEADVNARKRAWARLLSKGYEVDPLVCPRCGHEMKVIAVIEGPDETGRILRHLIQNGRSPPGFEPDRLTRPPQLTVSSHTVDARSISVLRPKTDRKPAILFNHPSERPPRLCLKASKAPSGPLWAVSLLHSRLKRCCGLAARDDFPYY